MFFAAVGELISLEHLDASYNQLETFPNQIYQCPVKTLNLSHNQIIRMPGCSVTDPKQLRLQYITDLDISYNKVRALLAIRATPHFCPGLVQALSQPSPSAPVALPFPTRTLVQVETLEREFNLFKRLKTLRAGYVSHTLSHVCIHPSTT